MFDAVYEELRRAAHRLMTRTAWDERSLEPTGLVNEAVLRLIRSPNLRDHVDPNYVFAAALTAMRRILGDPLPLRDASGNINGADSFGHLGLPPPLEARAPGR